jgi:hypothetical protein
MDNLRISASPETLVRIVGKLPISRFKFRPSVISRFKFWQSQNRKKVDPRQSSFLMSVLMPRRIFALSA